ncbi:transcriptional regulator, TetR family [Thermoactinomyces sp. DSM 45891]|uniref:TetR/AcrR family transcriptional regulator n=1 Tax=Thermoactinomyces sp. DSM 45891 TaxID=1761907 RepID=UPI0009111FAB|nr:TetR/AcrR family transcriptional regulator [Thermoactinomyces sp. DSM 45891]SFX59826.1 transcriptional regulator, TetR family [Thermoactinomyces sp. DSM 45891]
MARNKEFDPTLVLRKATEIFGHYGYEGTSMQNLLDGLGIARQSLYDTYGTKRELFILAIKHYLNEKSLAASEYLERPDSGKAAIADIFYQIATVLKDERRRNECFIICSAIDQIPHNPEIAAYFEKDKSRLEQAFYVALLRAKKQGELSNRQEDLLALSRYLYHARYSLTQAAKISSDPKVLDNIVAVILSTLD